MTTFNAVQVNVIMDVQGGWKLWLQYFYSDIGVLLLVFLMYLIITIRYLMHLLSEGHFSDLSNHIQMYCIWRMDQDQQSQVLAWTKQNFKELFPPLLFSIFISPEQEINMLCTVISVPCVLFHLFLTKIDFKVTKPIPRD